MGIPGGKPGSPHYNVGSNRVQQKYAITIKCPNILKKANVTKQTMLQQKPYVCSNEKVINNIISYQKD
jgi:hypothetical protein